MSNDLAVLWNGFLAFPTELHVIFGGLFGMVLWLIIITYHDRKDPRFYWYRRNIKNIDDAFTQVRRAHKCREARGKAYVEMYHKLSRELHYEIGANYVDYTTGQRSVVIHLLTRYRDVMYFYANNPK